MFSAHWYTYGESFAYSNFTNDTLILIAHLVLKWYDKALKNTSTLLIILFLATMFYGRNHPGTSRVLELKLFHYYLWGLPLQLVQMQLLHFGGFTGIILVFAIDSVSVRGSSSTSRCCPSPPTWHFHTFCCPTWALKSLGQGLFNFRTSAGSNSSCLHGPVLSASMTSAISWGSSVGFILKYHSLDLCTSAVHTCCSPYVCNLWGNNI